MLDSQTSAANYGLPPENVRVYGDSFQQRAFVHMADYTLSDSTGTCLQSHDTAVRCIDLLG